MQDKNYQVKVADFGLSQLLPEGVGDRDVNRMKGSPLWNAPEVLRREVNWIYYFYFFQKKI